ncbi:MAG: energy-coupling factor ABC transporter substrate-binding protein [Phormidium sp.]
MQIPRKSWHNWLLVSGVLVLAIAPLILIRGAEFGGADGKAESAIQEVNPNYKPWATPIFEPASGEIESLLFSVQAGLGAGVIGYVIGFYRGRKEQREQQEIREKNNG